MKSRKSHTTREAGVDRWVTHEPLALSDRVIRQELFLNQTNHDGKGQLTAGDDTWEWDRLAHRTGRKDCTVQIALHNLTEPWRINASSGHGTPPARVTRRNSKIEPRTRSQESFANKILNMEFVSQPETATGESRRSVWNTYVRPGLC